jgi:riboflavin synthase alpha subunit
VRDQLIDLCIIPTTQDKTNINQLSVESIVNIEFDILAKYTEQLLLKRNV